ncbi:MAG: MATE family efflux transporter [Lachnospiraceae bacterium]|nr:MATE family efflux transporter [Lachnospiraceae bacterium]
MQKNLTNGNITKSLFLFAIPMILGNLLQQTYNIADTLIVGRFIGTHALAAVGSSFSLMTFLTSIFLGLCMGSGTVFSIRFGQGETEKMREDVFVSFVLIAGITLTLNIVVFLLLDPILHLLQIPGEVYAMMKDYLMVIFWGIPAVFLYNYFASLLRALGNSAVPLVFLGISVVLNISFDLLFVIGFQWGIKGAAAATVLSQYVSGVGIGIFAMIKYPYIWPNRAHMRVRKGVLGEICHFSLLTCVQQSVMNLGILMVQGIVNSFGTAVMAAFAAAVKIDSFAYMPVQDFGNAFSTFIAQNHGAGKTERIRLGVKSAVLTAMGFSAAVSVVVFLFTEPLMMIFVSAKETKILQIGVQYLRIEGSFYFGIGLLFLLYGYYRAVEKPGMSVVLTGVSLGLRVLLAYVLSSNPALGVIGIWVSVPIGWILADLTGAVYYFYLKKKESGCGRIRQS